MPCMEHKAVGRCNHNFWLMKIQASIQCLSLYIPRKGMQWRWSTGGKCHLPTLVTALWRQIVDLSSASPLDLWVVSHKWKQANWPGRNFMKTYCGWFQIEKKKVEGSQKITNTMNKSKKSPTSRLRCHFSWLDTQPEKITERWKQDKKLAGVREKGRVRGAMGRQQRRHD